MTNDVEDGLLLSYHHVSFGENTVEGAIEPICIVIPS